MAIARTAFPVKGTLPSSPPPFSAPPAPPFPSPKTSRLVVLVRASGSSAKQNADSCLPVEALSAVTRITSGGSGEEREGKGMKGERGEDGGVNCFGELRAALGGLAARSVARTAVRTTEEVGTLYCACYEGLRKKGRPRK